MNTAFIRLAAGAAIAVALTGTAFAADAKLKPKATTTAEMAGKCIAATTMFAKLSEGDAKEGDDTSMTDLALTWIEFLKDKPEKYQAAALEGMASTADGYSKAVDRSSEEGLAMIASDMATCILEMDT